MFNSVKLKTGRKKNPVATARSLKVDLTCYIVATLIGIYRICDEKITCWFVPGGGGVGWRRGVEVEVGVEGGWSSRQAQADLFRPVYCCTPLQTFKRLLWEL